MKEDAGEGKSTRVISPWVKTLIVGGAGVVGGFLGLLCGVLIWWPVSQFDMGIFSGIASIFTGMFGGGFGAMKAGDIIGKWLDQY